MPMSLTCYDISLAWYIMSGYILSWYKKMPTHPTAHAPHTFRKSYLWFVVFQLQNVNDKSISQSEYYNTNKRSDIY